MRCWTILGWCLCLTAALGQDESPRFELRGKDELRIERLERSSGVFRRFRMSIRLKKTKTSTGRFELSLRVAGKRSTLKSQIGQPLDFVCGSNGQRCRLFVDEMAKKRIVGRLSIFSEDIEAGEFFSAGLYSRDGELRQDSLWGVPAARRPPAGVGADPGSLPRRPFYSFRLGSSDVLKIYSLESYAGRLRGLDVDIWLKESDISSGEFELEILGPKGSRRQRLSKGNHLELSFEGWSIRCRLTFDAPRPDSVVGRLRVISQTVGPRDFVAAATFGSDGLLQPSAWWTAPSARPRSQGLGPPSAKPGLGSSPRLLVRTDPPHTDRALQSRVEGEIRLLATVGRDGSISDFIVLQSLGYGLDSACIAEIANNWKLRPALVQGRPVEARSEFYVTFDLESP